MRIGITLDMSVAFWANGLQQNIVFLYSLLRSAGNKCLYITHKKPAYYLNKKHEGLLLKDLMDDPSEKLDVLIVAGFDLLPQMYDELKNRNPNLKIILLHLGNKLMDDIHYSICVDKPNKVPLEIPRHLSQIWISPHHKFAKNYLKCYYNTNKIKVAPYIWDPFFIQEKIKELSSKNLSPFFNNEKVTDVCIFEPNLSTIKNCIIPMSICENLEQKFPATITSVNAFCCEKLREKKYFFRYMERMQIVKSKKCFFNNRWGSFDALSKFGSTIVSHQIHNELNYAYLEALYLGLPLIHNSKILENQGYYYPEFDVNMGSNQLYNAILNHEKIKEEYMKESRKFTAQYSPYLQSNKQIYMSLLNES